LVVEDDASIAQEIAQTLQRFAYPVVGFAWNGEQALQMVQRLKPALVLMNVELRGDMDGIGAAALIKANLHVPVVYLSAFASDDTVRRAMLTEPFGYLVKPWRETDLRCAIEVALTRYRSEFALREREKLYQRLSLVDDLTHLHNRRGFQFLAEQQMRVARREKQPLALFFVDLNGLKRVNDQLGHAEGDRLLRSAAQVLVDTFRAPDIVARLSGDEFAILVIGASAPTGIQERLRKAVEIFNAVGENGLTLEMSVGWALQDHNCAASVDDLLSRADAAMYANKRATKV
jgi:diguanylate cyclase (GGDEF)-like protein